MGCDALADCSFRPSATAFFQLRTVEGLKNSSPSANVTESEVNGSMFDKTVYGLHQPFSQRTKSVVVEAIRAETSTPITGSQVFHHSAFANWRS